MEKKRGYFKQLMYDFWHIGELMPSKIEIFEDGNIEAFEIVQPKNQYVPSHIKYFNDKKRGIFRFSANDEDIPRKKLIDFDEDEDDEEW